MTDCTNAPLPAELVIAKAEAWLKNSIAHFDAELEKELAKGARYYSELKLRWPWQRPLSYEEARACARKSFMDNSWHPLHFERAYIRDKRVRVEQLLALARTAYCSFSKVNVGPADWNLLNQYSA